MSNAVRVECYSGYTYAQEPRSIEWQGQRYQVERIAKRWRTPAGPAFRVKVIAIPGSQSGISLAYPPGQASLQSPISSLIELHYLENEDKWTVTVYNSREEDQR